MRAIHPLSALLAAYLTNAHFFQQACPAPDLCYRLHIPPTTAQTGSGDIFLQIDALVSYTWLGIGLGTHMAGSKILVVYADGQGGITLSPRLGRGNYMPVYDGNADVELLPGSGVDGYKLTANIRCGDCSSWIGGRMDWTADAGSWIYGAKTGLPLNSKDPGDVLQMHDVHGVFKWRYGPAKGAIPSGANPDQPIPTLNITLQGLRPPTPPRIWQPTDAFPISHGTMASMAILVLFPLGAVLIRVTKERRLVWVHAGIQGGAYVLLFAAMGMGVSMASQGSLFNDKHPMIGLALVAMLLFQVFDGLLHHAQWLRLRKRRTKFAIAHIWTGRAVIVVGMINGGFGLQLAKVKSKGKIAGYAVVAILSFSCLVAAICYGERKRHIALEKRKKEREGKAAAGQGESTFE